MTTALPLPPADVPRPAAKSFVAHAKLIAGLTLVSRFFGLGREVVAGHYLGTAAVASAFTVAFTVPNLFRKLFGEGALSAAFIPLYTQAARADRAAADDFAAAAVNLLVVILIGLTVVGEVGLIGTIAVGHWSRDTALMLRLTAVMLPYVVLICGGAFLSGILQVHRRFGPPAAAPIVLNACHIAVLLIGARIVGLSGGRFDAAVEAKQTTLAYALAATVLVAGAIQVAVLLPSLLATGFRFKLVPRFWTPQVRRMLLLSLPVAMGAGVLQLSVLLDKGLSWFLMRKEGGVDTFRALGHVIHLPLELGAPRHLDLAQFLYQFPLGIFAIALATAIFPGLSADAFDADRERFRSALRQGIRASLWEGLPASLGLILVARPAAQLLFQHGEITAVDAGHIARDAAIYAGAIWAFSLLQIINRAYYAVHDMTTPLAMSAVNLAINVAVEVPLLWVMGEAGMAVGDAGQLRRAGRGDAVDARPQGRRTGPAADAGTGGENAGGYGRHGRGLLRGDAVAAVPDGDHTGGVGGTGWPAAHGRRGGVRRHVSGLGRAHDGRPAAPAATGASRSTTLTGVPALAVHGAVPR